MDQEEKKEIKKAHVPVIQPPGAGMTTNTYTGPVYTSNYATYPNFYPYTTGRG